MPVNASNTELGWKAPNFSLLNIDNQIYNLNDLKGENGTVIAFICNHCPYVLAIADRLSRESKELNKNSINTIAIMSNDVDQYPADSYENMKIFAKKYNFEFPYLYDENQNVAKAYKAVCTPDIYGFNRSLHLMYRGRIDSGVMNLKDSKIDRELFKAMIDIKDYGKVKKKQFNSFGCSIKWKNNE